MVSNMRPFSRKYLEKVFKRIRESAENDFYCKLPSQCDIEDWRYRLSKSLSIAANASLGMLRLSRSWLTWSLLHPHLGPTFKYKYKYNVQVQVQTTNTTTWDQYHLQIQTRLTYTKHDVNTTSISARRTIKANQHIFCSRNSKRTFCCCESRADFSAIAR